MGPYKILFLDIDGTILTPDDTIEDSTRRAIKEMKKQNIEVVLATGRPLHEISDLAEELQITSFIGYNGALGIYEGETTFSEPMNPEDVKYILDVAIANGHEVVFYTNSKNYFTSLETEAVQAFQKQFHLRQNDIFTEDAIGNVLGMTIITTGNKSDSLYQFNNGIHLSQVNIEGMQHCFDVIRDHVNKGIGVEFLLKKLGIKREESIAFGDGMNDKEMLAYAGEGFAMGNAHRDLFQHAKHKTTSVTDSGIYKGLKSLGLIEY
ncbi:HAD family hydrolase [Bacillus sp. ISL-35]|uniref:HAD family hydrolase n=1 Tax=Bacillus sp. ISL-35 TaxID=2819122 RepID=UPI001BEB006D|nr:HAD family hydrolase [Bacillus sp. ISL-35]MBT2680903.1 HAD family hydrolase [Bacillus sp. ISL-35]MBT2705219.1 HAD family hydrolase [Chryseobacterium sp. ISL-80]